MSINKLSIIYALCSVLFLSGCGPQAQWGAHYGEGPVGDAIELDTPSRIYGGERNIAVILPDSALGKSVRTAVEMAFIQKRASNVNVNFMDLSGGADNRKLVLESALRQNPDLIIGPIFAEDADMLRNLKPARTPVLSFTSDATALGGGIMTMSLIPSQSVETIIRRMPQENKRELLILAPDSASGYVMGHAALDSAAIHGIRIAGLYYYTAGNMDSMKNTAENATMFNARSSANMRAKEILSDILMNKEASSADKALVSMQLEERNKSDTIGDVPYDAVLFLGNATDSKALGSFLRYYDAPARKVKFYGTAMWDNEAMFRDMTFSGASYAAMPAISPEFANAYREITDTDPGRISSMGYDAAMLAIRALGSERSEMEFLTNPSGFRGIDGLIRLRPNGTSERALQVMTLDASGAPKITVTAATNFIKPLYLVTGQNGSRPSERKLSAGINPLDYIKLPESMRGKYSAKTYRQGPVTDHQSPITSHEVIILPEDDSEPIIDTEFEPMELESVSRVLVDEVTVR